MGSPGAPSSHWFSYAGKCKAPLVEVKLPIFLQGSHRQIEVLSFTTDTKDFICTDLGTIACVFQDPNPSNHMGLSSFPLSSFQWIRKLNFNLRLPLSAYEMLEGTGANLSGPGRPSGTETTACTLESQMLTWMQLHSSIAQLKRIQSLHICLDHDGESSWSLVNERATLLHLSPLSDIPDLAVKVTIPKLHPRFESVDRHFTEDSSPPWFELHRKLRQSYHGRNSPSDLSVTYKADFPILLGVANFAKTPLDVIERKERWLWRNGINVHEFKSRYFGGFRCGNVQQYIAVDNFEW